MKTHEALCAKVPAYNEFGYSEHPAILGRFLCIKIIDCDVKKSGYNEQFLSHLFTRCKRDSVYLSHL